MVVEGLGLIVYIDNMTIALRTRKVRYIRQKKTQGFARIVTSYYDYY